MTSQPRRAQRPPPSPSPPCVSIPSPMEVDSPPPSTSTFPARSPGLLIYFDPTSARARKLSEDLLNFASTSTPIITTKPSEATHVVLNPFSKFGEDFLRPRTSTSPHPFLSPSSTSQPQYILALRWIEDSIRLEQWQSEESYLYVPRVEEEERLKEVSNQTGGGEDVELELETPEVAREGVDEVEKEREPVQEVAEEETPPATILRKKEGSGMVVDPVPEQVVVDDASDDDIWTLSPKATRLASEDEQLARYFASVPPTFDLFARDRQGRDRFDWYTVAVRSERTAEEWRREYHRRDYYFLAMVEIMRNEKKLGSGNGKRNADSSSVAGKTTKRSRKQSDGQSSESRRGTAWTSMEVEDLRLCLHTSTTVQEAAVKFNKLRPFRTVSSASVYYSTHRETFKGDVHHIRHLESSSKPLTNDESDRLAQLYTQLRVFCQAANAYAEENPQHTASHITRWYYSHKEFFDKKVEALRPAQAVLKAKSTPKPVVWTDSLLKEFGFHLSALGNNPEPGFRTFNLKYPGTTINDLRWLYYSNKFRFQAMFQAMRTDPSLSSFSWSATSNNPPPVPPPPPLPTRFAGPYCSNQPSSVASGSKPLYAYSSPTILPPHPRSAPIFQQQAPTFPQQAPIVQQNPQPHPPFLPPTLSSIVRKLPSLPPSLEPPSFLHLGVGPSSSSSSSIYCYFCGVGDERAQFIRQIELVQPSRLVCDCCLAALNDRIYEGGAMARMGGTEKLEWVVGVLKVNGMAKRRLKVRVRDGGMALGKG